MNKIEQILCRRSIDGAKQIRQLFNNWSDEEIVQFYRELESYASQQMPSDDTFEQVLKEEFLVNTQNYPKEYHDLFMKKFRRAESKFKSLTKD